MYHDQWSVNSSQTCQVMSACGHVSKTDGPVLVCSDMAKAVLSSGLPVGWPSVSGIVGGGGGGRDWLTTVSVADAVVVAEDDDG